MKRKWSLLTLCLTLLMGLSLCLFAACGDGEKNVITAALSKTQVEVGETVTVTYSATEGEVSVTYKKDGGEAVTFTGTTFTPSAAGTYVFTFTAEGAEDVSKTLNVTEKTVTPATPVITASANKSEIFVGESVTFTYSATENAAVTVTYTKNGAAASGLTVTSGTPVTISEAGAYVFTFAAEGAESKTVSVTVKTRPVISLTVDDIPMTSGTTVPVCVGTTVDYVASVTEGAVLSASYKIGDAEPDALTSLSDEFTFDTVGTYVFTLTADGADTFTLTVTVAAHAYGNTLTYTEAGYEAAGSTDTIGCSNHYGCGTSITVDLPELTAGGWSEQVTQNATCTAAGSKTMTCTVTASDGATQVTITVTGVEIPKIAHTLVKTEAKTVTCTEAGWNEYWTCSACDEIFTTNSQDAGTGTTDVTQVDSIYIPAAHTYGAGVWNNTEGKVEFTCSKNDSTVSADIVSLTLKGTSVEVTVDASGKIEFIEGELTVTGGYNAVADTNIVAGSIAIPYDDAGLTWTASKADQTLTVALGNVTSKALRVTVTESVKPVISLTVNEESMTNGDSVSVCVGTQIAYAATVSKGTISSAVYTVNGKNETTLENTSGNFTFETAGKYVFTIKAEGATDFVYTVTVAHVYGAWTVTTKPSTSSLGVAERTCKNCTHKDTLKLPALDETNYTYAAVQPSTCTEAGGATYTYNQDNSIVITVSLPLAAHSGTYAYGVAQKAVVFTCGNCDYTENCAITGITVTGDPATAYVVKDGDTYTAYGFTVEAVYTGVEGNAATQIFIPLDDENLAVTSVSGDYKAATVTFTYDGTMSDATDNAAFTVYEKAVEAGAVTNEKTGDKLVPLGTYTGEFELRYALSNIVRTGSDSDSGGCSWVITFDSGSGKELILREDNWIGTNFGRTVGQIVTEGSDLAHADGVEASFVGFETKNNAFWTELNDFTNPQFVITRSYADGVYTITVTISEGAKSVAISIAEPAANGNIMTVSLGSLTYNGKGNPSYNYSAVLGAEKALTVSGIAPSTESITVPAGTSMNDALASVTVTVSYNESTLKDTVAATACSPVCETYKPDETGDNVVTLTYGGQTTTVTISVDAAHVHNYIDGVCECGNVCAHTNIVEGVCTDCGATWTTTSVNQTYQNITTGFVTWHEFDGVKLTRANSKLVVTGTQSTNAAENYHTVLWEFKEGFTGRLDAHGWTFTPSSLGDGYTTSQTQIQNNETVYTTEDESFWTYFKELVKDSNFTLTFEWNEQSTITVTVEAVANSGTLSGATYTCVYTLPITNSGTTEFTLHLTAEQVNSFTVTNYSMYTWTE